MGYKVRDLINEGWNEDYNIDREKFYPAYSLIQNAITRSNVALVQGPPGTGKTTVYQSVLHDSLDKLTDGKTLLYVCPTNKLVSDMVKKIATGYKHLGKNQADLFREVRIYGSQFNFDHGFKPMNAQLNNEVKLVIATEYQRVVPNLQGFHLLVDEASKSPIHRPFISVADQLLKSMLENRDRPLGSICVIGDPQQAIALNEFYKDDRELIMMVTFIRGLLDSSVKKEIDRGNMQLLTAALSNLKGKYFEFLQQSRRLPHPSEEPISHGFYEDMLKAEATTKERFSGLRDGGDAAINFLKAEDSDLRLATETIVDALSTERPIIYLRPRNKGYPIKDLRYDPHRAKWGVIFAVCLAAITGLSTGVITTYTDQWTQMQMMYQRHYLHILRRLKRKTDLIEFATVHRMLGSEKDNVVCILGKEHRHSDIMATIYFNEPELLNVGFSRHRRIMVIIGDLNMLINSVTNRKQQDKRTARYRSLKLTAEALYRQAGLEQTTDGELRVISQGGGDACVYRDI